MAELIGGSFSKSTWGSLRSPMWKGSGFRGQTPFWDPVNKNEHNDTNSKYVENLGELSVAFPFVESTGIADWSASMCLGLRDVFIQYGSYDPENPEESTPAIVDFYLALGEGYITSTSESYSYEYVICGYSFSWPFPGFVGYDTLKAREQYRGAVVNVTFTPGPDMSPVTTDVTITDDLFPDNLSFGFGSPNGIYIGTYTWPINPSGNWDQPYWTINSFTMPS